MPFNLPIVGEIFWNSLLIKEPYLCSLPQQNVRLGRFLYFVIVQYKWQRNVQKSVMHVQSFLIAFAVANLKLPLLHMHGLQFFFNNT